MCWLHKSSRCWLQTQDIVLRYLPDLMCSDGVTTILCLNLRMANILALPESYFVVICMRGDLVCVSELPRFFLRTSCSRTRSDLSTEKATFFKVCCGPLGKGFAFST